MPCELGTDKDGVGYIICSRVRRRRCGQPGCRDWSTVLCDYALHGAGKKTCDAPLCARHAHRLQDVTSVSGGLRTVDSIDYCPTHFQLTRAPFAPPANDDGQPRQLTLGERVDHLPATPAPVPTVVRLPVPAPTAARTSAELALELLHTLDRIGTP